MPIKNKIYWLINNNKDVIWNFNDLRVENSSIEFLSRCTRLPIGVICTYYILPQPKYYGDCYVNVQRM